MATITNTKLEFVSGGEHITTGNYHFPVGTVSLFYLTNAPGEWSQVTTHNNKAFRVAAGSGGGQEAGSNGFTGTFDVKTVSGNFNCSINSKNVGNHSMSVNTMASHSHPINNGPNQNSASPHPITGNRTVRTGNGNSGNAGNSANHNHGSNASASGSFSQNIDFRVKYVDIILCQYGGT